MDNESRKPGVASSGEEKVVMTSCNSHCGGQCLLKVHVKNGVITRIETDDGEEPQLRACLKGRAQRQRVYAPDRLKYPMKKVGPRGGGKFERITWDEALDTVASEIKRVRDTYGPGAIIFRGGGGDLTLLHGRSTIDRLLAMAGGYSQTWGSVSLEGARYAALASFGTVATHSSRDNLLKSKFILLWGVNPAYTVLETNTCWYLARAREAGTRIVCVDPKHTDTAAMLSDEWVPIRPGTDAAMLIAMAHTIISENLHDRTYLEKYTVGFEKYRDYVMGVEDGVAKTPAWAESITGVPAATIQGLAREYARAKPAALIAGISPGRTAYGEQYHRAAITLAAMTGNIGVAGGDSAAKCWAGFNAYPFIKPAWGRTLGIPNPVDSNSPLRKYAVTGGTEIRDRGRLNTSLVADGLLRGREGGYPFDYKLLYITNANTVNQAPDVNKNIRAFLKAEFVVVQEQFMTATARYADILLPTSVFLEKNDFCVGGTSNGFMNKVVEPPYECRSQFEIACALANKLGLEGYSDKNEEEWLKQMASESLVPDYEEFKRKAFYKPESAKEYVAFRKQIEDPAGNPFLTRSGKIEIYSQQLADMQHPNIPPVPKYVEAWESPSDPIARKYPLQLVSTHFKRRAHSQFDNIPWVAERQTQAILINSRDAATRGISSGDKVRVFNDRGRMVIEARVSERIMPGVVDIPQGAWHNPDPDGVDHGGCANVLTSDRISPGGAVPFNSCLVEVRRA